MHRKSPTLRELIGERFGRLVVLEKAGQDVRHQRRWFCRCDCGGEVVATTASLVSGSVKSCKCLRVDAVGDAHRRHGMTASPTWRSWKSMMDRCYTPTTNGFEHWGGRGIAVDPKWHTFECFFEDMGLRPAGMTLDRVDNDGDYSKLNCRWATPAEQSKNRRSSRIITVRGEAHCVADWARILGRASSTLYERSDEQIVALIEESQCA